MCSWMNKYNNFEEGTFVTHATCIYDKLRTLVTRLFAMRLDQQLLAVRAGPPRPDLLKRASLPRVPYPAVFKNYPSVDDKAL